MEQGAFLGDLQKDNDSCCLIIINFIYKALITFITQVKVTPRHVAECKRLLTLMGVPFVEVSNKIIWFSNTGTNFP